ncbi:MAG: hypothetical protein JNM56_00970, partial [Planctomycetia bacterium]|nr:hypothetical protein [Planctomycetia bacterium]
MNDPLPKIELLSLLFLPLAGAIVVALLGPNRPELVRRVSLGVTVVILFLAILLAWRYIEEPARSLATADQLPTFRPVFVPGSPGTMQATGRQVPNPYGTSWDLVPLGPAAIQFY